MAESTAPGPKKRTIRTVIQSVIGTAVAVPAAIGALQASGADVDPALVAWGGGIAGAFVILASAAMNAWDSAHGES